MKESSIQKSRAGSTWKNMKNKIEPVKFSHDNSWGKCEHLNWKIRIVMQMTCRFGIVRHIIGGKPYNR